MLIENKIETLINCENPIELSIAKIRDDDNYNTILTACGKCEVCQKNKASQRARRLDNELQYYHISRLSETDKAELKLYRTNINQFHFIYIYSEYKAVFCTLTYNQSSIALNQSLVKKDVQDYIKRVRRAIEYRVERDLRIKAKTNDYYKNIYNDNLARAEYLKKEKAKKYLKISYVGEYGENGNRPHYHLLIFNLSPCLSNFELLANKWTKGKSQFEAIQSAQKSTSYVSKVSKYVSKVQDKKYYDKNIFILQHNKEFVFHQLSKNLGYRYVKDNAINLYNNLGEYKYSKASAIHKDLIKKSKIALTRRQKIWLERLGYIDVFDKAKAEYRKNFNDFVDEKIKKYNLKLSDFNKDRSKDDFYNISLHKDLFTYSLNKLTELNKLQNDNNQFWQEALPPSYNKIKSQLSINYDIDLNINLSDKDLKNKLSNLKPKERLNYFNKEKNIYISYIAENSDKRSVSKDYSLYARNLIQFKTRYKKYYNNAVFSEVQANFDLQEHLKRLDNYVIKRFNNLNMFDSRDDYISYLNSQILDNYYETQLKNDDLFLEFVIYSKKIDKQTKYMIKYNSHKKVIREYQQEVKDFNNLTQKDIDFTYDLDTYITNSYDNNSIIDFDKEYDFYDKYT